MDEHVYPQGIKWTKQRKDVYNILCHSIEPLTPAQIFKRIEQESDGADYAPSTIYRILSAFEEKDLVSKSTDMSDGQSLYELNRGGHRHYAVCLDCKKRFPMESCPFSLMHLERGKGKVQEDFMVVGHKLELYGYCGDCRGTHEQS